MSEASTLDERIFRIRRSLRERQPLDERIALVRARHRAARRALGEKRLSRTERKS
ncbi:MAG: hypothetical protein KDN18_16155 [Verrucomicrobiae bacterium]|nr:hypothetical protein [Verrucomicrobiae bacterium]